MIAPGRRISSLLLLAGLVLAGWAWSPSGLKGAEAAQPGDGARQGEVRKKKASTARAVPPSKGARAAPRKSFKSAKPATPTKAARASVRKPTPRAAALTRAMGAPAAASPLPAPLSRSTPPEPRVAPLPTWENRPDWKPLTAPFLYPVPESAAENS